MPIEAPSRFIQNQYTQYPDDNSMKDVYFQAQGLDYAEAGDRHVLLWWINGMYKETNGQVTMVTQIVQLSGGIGNYAFFSPVAKKRSTNTVQVNYCVSLGKFTRAQRDQIIKLADGVQFSKNSVVNGCRVWTKDLLKAMVRAKLISQKILDDIDRAVPLKDRVAEVQ